MPDKFHLYFDDTGSRDPDKSARANAAQAADVEMDCFGLGGILLRESDIDGIIAAHKDFCREHDISYPLHSWSIRGGRKEFGWLKTPEKAGIFMASLEDYLLSLPVVAIACIIHRPGYVARYKDKYRDRLWYMCKTAFSILIERAAKYVDEQGGAMEVYFEQCGKKEDRDIIRYMRELKAGGQEFNQDTSRQYAPFGPEDFRRICLGKPIRKTKKTPMIQIADLVLFPMAKGGYNPSYRPYEKLRGAGKLIDCHLAEVDIPLRGIKYSCFDG